VFRSRAFATLTGALLMGGGAERAGAEPSGRERPHDGAHRPRIEVLLDLDGANRERGWLDLHLERVHLHKKSGLAYTRRVERSGTDLELSVVGPALERRRVGIAFEIRF
jgi:hypothetical protein